MIVVSDSGPLISLMKAGLLHITEGLYGTVSIPEAVYAELTGNDRYIEEAARIRSSAFIVIVPVKDRNKVMALQRTSGLDLGESEAIVCAEEVGADILLIEENAGRKEAKSRGLHVRGSIGLILLS